MPFLPLDVSPLPKRDYLMEQLIAYLSDIQSAIEKTDRWQADQSGSEFDNGASCGAIEGRLTALKEVRLHILQILRELSE